MKVVNFGTIRGRKIISHKLTEWLTQNQQTVRPCSCSMSSACNNIWNISVISQIQSFMRQIMTQVEQSTSCTFYHFFNTVVILSIASPHIVELKIIHSDNKYSANMATPWWPVWADYISAISDLVQGLRMSPLLTRMYWLLFCHIWLLSWVATLDREIRL